MPEKEIKIKHRKLGREHAHGLAWKHLNKIEIDPRLKGYVYFLTLIHEALHIIAPDWSETKVTKKSGQMARALWRQGIRKVDL